IVLSVEALQKAALENPFKGVEADPKSVHLFFMATAPKAPDMAALNNARQDSETFVLKDSVFYLHAPDGMARSKLAINAEKWLGVPATARNWRTVSKILELAQQN